MEEKDSKSSVLSSLGLQCGSICLPFENALQSIGCDTPKPSDLPASQFAVFNEGDWIRYREAVTTKQRPRNTNSVSIVESESDRIHMKERALRCSMINKQRQKQQAGQNITPAVRSDNGQTANQINELNKVAQRGAKPTRVGAAPVASEEFEAKKRFGKRIIDRIAFLKLYSDLIEGDHNLELKDKVLMFSVMHEWDIESVIKVMESQDDNCSYEVQWAWPGTIRGKARVCQVKNAIQKQENFEQTWEEAIEMVMTSFRGELEATTPVEFLINQHTSKATASLSGQRSASKALTRPASPARSSSPNQSRPIPTYTQSTKAYKSAEQSYRSPSPQRFHSPQHGPRSASPHVESRRTTRRKSLEDGVRSPSPRPPQRAQSPQLWRQQPKLYGHFKFDDLKISCQQSGAQMAVAIRSQQSYKKYHDSLDFSHKEYTTRKVISGNPVITKKQ